MNKIVQLKIEGSKLWNKNYKRIKNKRTQIMDRKLLEY